MNKPTVIDFFCGAGGFSEGFRQLDFQIIAGYDSWKPAIDTFNFNFNLSCQTKNVLDFRTPSDIDLIPNSDIILGSPPCVSFSNSNKSGKADKSLGIQLIKAYLRIVTVKKYQPNSTLKGWFMENVPNSQKFLPDTFSFLDLDLGDWAISNNLKPTNVAIQLEGNGLVLNSADFGSYQSRNRLITGEFIGIDSFIESRMLQKINGKNHLNNIKKFRSLMPSPYSKINLLKDELKDPQYEASLPMHLLTDHFYDTGVYRLEWEAAKFLKTNHPYMGKMSFPENEEKPSRTITATQTPHSRETILYKCEISRIGNGEYRTPTLREAACIMGFPISYQFIGKENSKWRLVGNAVSCSISRTLAEVVIIELTLEKPRKLKLNLSPHIDKVYNLNTFALKKFNDPPAKKTGSRFRMHPFKYGNLTVSLSNYCIERNSKYQGRWYTSIQYGNGDGFPIQKISNNYYKKIEHILIQLKGGKEFLKKINNGFSEKIPDATNLQKIYEGNSLVKDRNLLGPSEIIDNIKIILRQLNIGDELIELEDSRVFRYKSRIPKSQLFVLYAINKATSLVNGKVNAR